MSNTIRITILALVTLIVVFLLSCGGDTPSDPIIEPRFPGVYGKVVNSDGAALSDAKVHLMFPALDHPHTASPKAHGQKHQAIHIGTTPTITAYQLYQNFPNPFWGSTTIGFRMETSNRVRLGVLTWPERDATKTIVDQELNAGEHRVIWDGKDNSGRWVANGIYICKLQIGEESMERTMLVYDPSPVFLRDQNIPAFATTNSHGEFFIRSGRLPIGQNIPVTDENSPTILYIHRISDTLALAVVKDDLQPDVQKIGIDTTQTYETTFRLQQPFWRSIGDFGLNWVGLVDLDQKGRIYVVANNVFRSTDRGNS